MKPVLYLAAALAVLATAPASAQAPSDGGGTPSPGPPSGGTPSGFLDYSGLPFTNVPRTDFERRYAPRQCFDGRKLVGVSRSGEKTLYVQGRSGAIFRLDLEKACPSLSAAQKLTVRAYAQHVVCAENVATVLVKTATGKAQCRVAMVSRLSSTEVAELSGASRR